MSWLKWALQPALVAALMLCVGCDDGAKQDTAKPAGTNPDPAAGKAKPEAPKAAPAGDNKDSKTAPADDNKDKKDAGTGDKAPAPSAPANDDVKKADVAKKADEAKKVEENKKADESKKDASPSLEAPKVDKPETKKG